MRLRCLGRHRIDVIPPGLHHFAPLLEHVAAEVGGFRFIAQRMCERGFPPLVTASRSEFSVSAISSDKAPRVLGLAGLFILASIGGIGCSLSTLARPSRD